MLSACSYALSDSVQEVAFETPGAQGAECAVYVEGLRFSVSPPQSINLPNSRHNLEVTCKAPGYREQTIYIKPHFSDTSLLNVANAGAGFVLDYASDALFKYPDVIRVDFTDTPVSDPPIPAQNAPDIRQPEDYPLEEYRPGQPRLNSDRYKEEPEILRRGGAPISSESGGASAYSSDAFYEPVGDLGGKGAPNSAELDPSGAPSQAIIPGE